MQRSVIAEIINVWKRPFSLFMTLVCHFVNVYFFFLPACLFSLLTPPPICSHLLPLLLLTHELTGPF